MLIQVKLLHSALFLFLLVVFRPVLVFCQSSSIIRIILLTRRCVFYVVDLLGSDFVFWLSVYYFFRS
jgi:hypothetical protein